MDGTLILLELTKIRILLMVIVVLFALIVLGVLIVVVVGLFNHYDKQIDKLLKDSDEGS